MTAYEKWIDYVSGALVAFAAVLGFIVGDWFGGLLFATILVIHIFSHVQKRQISGLREDLDLALKREREYLYRALAAETALAYAKYDNPPVSNVPKRGDAE